MADEAAAGDVPEWELAAKFGAAVEEALTATALEFLDPPDVIATHGPFLNKIMRHVTGPHPVGLEPNHVIALRHDGAPYSVAAYRASAGHSLFKVAARSADTIKLTFIGVMASKNVRAAEMAKGVAAFGAIGRVFVVLRDVFTHAALLTHRMQDVIERLEAEMLPGAAPVANPPLGNDDRTRLADMEARMSDMNVTISKLVESNSKLEADILQLKKAMEELKRAQAMTQDPRLRYFGVSVSGSNSRSSRSNSADKRAAKSEKAARLRDMKAQVKDFFGPTPTCFFCGTTEAVSIAHIVSTGKVAYDHFGPTYGYRTPLNVFSVRNFIPLCGTLGQRDSCHDAYNRHLVAILHNPFEQRYFLLCAEDAPGRLVAFSQAPGHCLK